VVVPLLYVHVAHIYEPKSIYSLQGREFGQGLINGSTGSPTTPQKKEKKKKKKIHDAHGTLGCTLPKAVILLLVSIRFNSF